jgi:hypothetical protein
MRLGFLGGRAFLVLALSLLSLLPVASTAARSETPTEVHVEGSGTLEASVHSPGQSSGERTITVSVKWSEKQSFDASTGDPISRAKVQVSGSEKFFDDATIDGTPEGTLEDNCTGKLSVKPYRQWSFIGLMAGGIDQYGPSKGVVTAMAGNPAASYGPSAQFIKSKGPGDCSTYTIPLDTTENKYGNVEQQWFSAHAGFRTHFRDTELSFKVRHQPFRYKNNVGVFSYSAEMINRFSVTTS